MKMTVYLGQNSYDVILKRGALSNLRHLTDLTHRKVLVVTDDGVPARYARTVLDQCVDGRIVTVPQGEASKSMKVYAGVLQEMLAFGMDRGSAVVAVGGGVVGDMAGFAAATFMRGIDFINCPTTTLSQIDSSIGGKVAIDLGAYKNVVGSFWQPRLVVIDPDTLDTLPERQYVNGMAEAIKAGLICDAGLFELFEKGDIHKDAEEIIYKSLLVKKRVVEKDERENGQRQILNFGHTIGHAIEAVKGVKGRRKNGLYHGECVALGMLPMIEDRQLAKRTRAVYRKIGLPARCGYNKHKVLEYMRHDKKSRGGTITVVKVPGLGCWSLERIRMKDELPALIGLPGED